MTFRTPIWHPNVYDDGKVCISILHPPGEDRFNENEKASERWRPILGVEQIIVSVISMLSDPNDESPANIDAAVSSCSESVLLSSSLTFYLFHFPFLFFLLC
jgi:ubiquitin-conjugating enzyme E2 G1